MGGEGEGGEGEGGTAAAECTKREGIEHMLLAVSLVSSLHGAGTGKYVGRFLP